MLQSLSNVHRKLKHILHLQMTEDDEVLVCAHGEGWMANAKEQQGYVKVLHFPHLL